MLSLREEKSVSLSGEEAEPHLAFLRGSCSASPEMLIPAVGGDWATPPDGWMEVKPGSRSPLPIKVALKCV